MNDSLGENQVLVFHFFFINHDDSSSCVVFHIFLLITVESTSRSSKRKGALVGIGGATVVGNRGPPHCTTTPNEGNTLYAIYICDMR